MRLTTTMKISRWRTSSVRLALMILMTTIVSLPLPAVSQPQDVDNNFIEATINYPAIVKAGENFTITATLLNTSGVPVLTTVYWILRGGTIAGSHAPSYRILTDPLREAQPFLRIILEPGVPRTVSLREFFYEGEDIFSGELVIQESLMRISDTTWQTAVTVINPITIEVIHEGTEETTTPPQIPVRSPLERRAITTQSDPAWVVYDPNTGFEWLPLTRTLDKSLVSVIVQLESGAELEGFRIANLDELRTLFLNAVYASGIHYPDYAMFAQEEYEGGDLVVASALVPVVETILEQFGITRSVTRPEHDSNSAVGILVGTSDVPNAVLEATVFTVRNPDRGMFYLSPASEFQVNGLNNDAGVWLLRESD